MMGQGLGQGLSNFFQQQYQRGMLQKSLQQAQQAMKQPGASPLDKMFAFMQAGAGIPGSERYLATLLPEVLRISQAEAAQKAPFGMPTQEAQLGQPPTQLGIQPTGQAPAIEQDLQTFLQGAQGNQFYPSNVGAQQPPGNLPQPATTGFVQPVASNQQLLQMSKPYAAQKTAAGIATTPAQAYEELKALNDDNKEANKLIEQERQQRVASQREYGQIASNKLARVFPDASDEEQAYIKKKVEELAGENKSEADIERLAAGEARKYKNMLSKVAQDIPASRIYNRPFQKLMGTDKSAEQARKDLRLKVKPLLDAGLYDKARDLLAERGYFPEEREMVVTDLGENSLKSLSKMPKIANNADMALEDGYSQGQPELFKQNLADVLQADPKANLILLRRKYELEKGVHWRLFKDSLNELEESGQFVPDDDQFNQLNTLDQPPLNKLDKLLHGLGIIGR